LAASICASAPATDDVEPESAARAQLKKFAAAWAA